MYRVHIQSVDPGHEWIKRFVSDLAAQHGAPIEEILYFAKFQIGPGSCHYHEAKKAEEAACKDTIQCTCHLLLEPNAHKHYLVSVAQLQTKLLTNPHAIIIYDTRGIIAGSTFPTIMDFLNLIWYLEKEFGKERVLCRRRALMHLADLLRSPMPEPDLTLSERIFASDTI